VAHPDISKAREARNKAHADVVAHMRALRADIAVALQLAGGRHHIPRGDLDGIEKGVDNLKGSLVHYANACSTVEFLEEG
jgi:hypothetical protein